MPDWVLYVVASVLPLGIHLIARANEQKRVAVRPDTSSVNPDVRDSVKTTITPVADHRLPWQLRNRRATDFAELQKLGFSHSHNERCLRRRTKCYSSHYLSEDGVTLICVCKPSGLLSWLTFEIGIETVARSVLADGTVVETATRQAITSVLHNLPPDSYLVISGSGAQSKAELLSFHNDVLAKETWEKATEPIEITPEMIPELEEYTLQLVDWELYRKGVLQRPPGPLSFAGRDLAPPH